MSWLAMVGLRRCPSILTSNNAILNRISQGNEAPNLRMSTLHNDVLNRFLTPSLINPGSGFPVKVAFLHITPIENLVVQGNSTEESSGPCMGSIMNHPEYKEMYKRLSKAAKSPLDIVCCHILSKGVIVNQEILKLDALSPSSHIQKDYKGNTKIKEKEQRGFVKIGKFNIKDDRAIERGFETLVDETKVDKKALVEELFAENEGAGRWRDDAFMLKRQLVGFWLLQFVENGNMRLPMKVHDRLNVILSGGKFTKKEDKAILAWVKKHGETGWKDLARSLGRNYLGAGVAVKVRYEKLLVGYTGAFSEEEDAFIIGEVIKQVPDAFEKPYHEIKVEFKTIVSQMEKRTGSTVKNRFQGILHPTIMRSKAGTLDKDVRAELIQKVKENKWIYNADIKFDRLALMPEFEGHNSASLQKLYAGIVLGAKKRFGLNSHKEVTVDQVGEWWNTSERKPKTETLIEHEQQIVEAYRAAKREL